MSHSVSIIRWDGKQAAAADDDVAREEPLEIRVRGRAISVTMRTPGDDAELAAGFLLSEGIVKGTSDILIVQPCDQDEDGNVVNVLLAAEVYVDFQKLTRHVFASSSCGLCGKATIEAVRSTFPAVDSSMRVSAEILKNMPRTMRMVQSEFERTGGLHAAAAVRHIRQAHRAA